MCFQTFCCHPSANTTVISSVASRPHSASPEELCGVRTPSQPQINGKLLALSVKTQGCKYLKLKYFTGIIQANHAKAFVFSILK